MATPLYEQHSPSRSGSPVPRRPARTPLRAESKVPALHRSGLGGGLRPLQSRPCSSPEAGVGISRPRSTPCMCRGGSNRSVRRLGWRLRGRISGHWNVAEARAGLASPQREALVRVATQVECRGRFRPRAGAAEKQVLRGSFLVSPRDLSTPIASACLCSGEHQEPRAP